ncbi:MAG: substrate-binding domain-containing protein [Eubacterium sp.]|jgi:phosphate transport system substrate-binding protein|nr:substrate-binding domain-containing protein [Eubacterium sp.]
MKKKLSLFLAICLSGTALLAGCETVPAAPVVTSADTTLEPLGGPTGSIYVVSREDGSGTRGAFVELFEILDDSDVDQTTISAEITNSTSVMMTTIANNNESIGYISLGSLNDTIKALMVDGIVANTDNVKSGAYKISRPFIIAHLEGLSEIGQDFVNYILSDEGQTVIEDNGYISDFKGVSYQASGISGTLTIGGSSSVNPVMEALRESYISINPGANIELTMSDSSTGMTDAINGVLEIGMSSRELKDTELAEGLIPTVIAIDGLAVIVNKNNPLENITKEQIKSIFIGETTEWSTFS